MARKKGKSKVQAVPAQVVVVSEEKNKDSWTGQTVVKRVICVADDAQSLKDAAAARLGISVNNILGYKRNQNLAGRVLRRS